HRNLYNADCNTYFYNPELWQPEGPPYSARAIQRFVDRLADSGIDTLLANPNTQVVWYPSRKLEKCTAGYRRGDRDSLRAQADGPSLHGSGSTTRARRCDATCSSSSARESRTTTSTASSSTGSAIRSVVSRSRPRGRSRR